MKPFDLFKAIDSNLGEALGHRHDPSIEENPIGSTHIKHDITLGVRDYITRFRYWNYGPDGIAMDYDIIDLNYNEVVGFQILVMVDDFMIFNKFEDLGLKPDYELRFWFDPDTLIEGEPQHILERAVEGTIEFLKR